MEAIPALIQALSDTSKTVGGAASLALWQNTGESLGEDADARQQWWQAHQP